MSKTIDQRVVEMQFDNRHFEKNVSTTMSTLDKLKQKLHLPGATKGLEDVNSAAKKVNLAGIGTAVETVQAKFSALDVMAVTALSNITNQAVNAGKRIASALTIDPIKTGFQEYETQINAVQTILANTQSKGTTIDDVNKALDELNAYADMTIYNFTEMTRNIGTFTAAGIDLETSVNAIQGIANLAAVSGSTSQQASTAMYQLSQALAAGTVKLMDWNSVVNAGMGGQVFQDALKKTSELLGTGAEAAIKAEGSFRESLSTGWLTAEVLTETLKTFTTSGANEYVAEYTGLSQEAVQAALDAAEAQYGEAEAIEHASQALAEKSGKNKDEIKQALEFAKTAQDAATKVKTFTQLWDVLKEAAQSGWTQTWEIIIGDFEEAKALLTPLSDFLTGIINGFSETRNALLEAALNNPFTDLLNKIEGTVAGVDSVTGALKDYDQVVKEIIRGDWGNYTERWEALEKAGYDWKHAQNLVNEELGCSLRRATDYKEAQDDLNSSTEAGNRHRTITIDQLTKMSDAQLKLLGYTEDEIKQLRDLARYAEAAGVSADYFVKHIDELNGRALLIDSFKNIGQSLVKIFTAMGEAWREIFPPMEAVRLYEIIAGLHRFTESLVMSDETAGELKRTLKGLFAALDIVLTVIGGPIKLAFGAVVKILENFDMNILQFTANVGDAIVAVRDWVDEHNVLYEALKAIGTALKPAIDSIRNWIDSLKESEDLPKDIANGIVNGFAQIPTFIANVFQGIKDQVANGFANVGDSAIGGFIQKIQNGLSIAGQTVVELGKIILEKINGVLTAHGFEAISMDVINGLVNGLKDGAKNVWNAAVEMAKQLWQGFCDFMGIHSPSTAMFEAGKNVVLGLINGIKSLFSGVWTVVSSLGSMIVEGIKNVAPNIAEGLKNVDLGSIVATIFAGLTTVVGMKAADALSSLASPFEGIGDLLGGLAENMKHFAKGFIQISKGLKSMFKGIGSYFRGKALKVAAEGILTFALAIGVLVASIVVLTMLDTGKMVGAIVALAALAGIMVVLSVAISKLGAMEGFGAAKFAATMIGIGIGLLLLTKALSTLSEIPREGLDNGAQAIFILSSMLAGLMVVAKFSGGIAGVGGTLIKMGVAMLALILVAKLVSKLNPEEMIKGGLGILALGGVMVGLVALTKLAGKDVGKVGGTLLKMSLAILLLVGVAKLVASIPGEDLTKGIIAITAFGGIMVGLIAMTKLATGNTKGLGVTLLGMAAAIGVMAITAKVLGTMSLSELAKGTLAVAIFGGMIVGLIAATKLAGNAKGLGIQMLLISAAIGILAVIAVVLSLMDVQHLAKGIIAVGLLSAMMAGLIAVCKFATGEMKNLIVLTVAIGVLAGACALLSFIEPERLLSASAALGVLMGAFALMIKTTSGVKSSLGSVIIMALVVSALAGVMYLLASLPIEASITAAASLSILLLSLAASMAIISKTAGINPMALAAMGVMVLVVGALGGILYLLKDLPVESTLGIVTSISSFLLLMTGVLVVLTAIGPFASAAMAGMAALGVLIAGLTVVLTALGGLSKIPGFNELIKDGGETLALIGYALGKFVGSIVGGVAAGISSGLPEIGTNLSAFMVNLMPFITIAKTIDETVLAGVGIISAAVLALTAAELINGIASFISFGQSSLPQLGADLSAFAYNALPFFNTAKMIDASVGEGIKYLAEAILVLTAADVLEGLTSWLTGGSSLASFGEQLPALGDGLSKFSSSLGEGFNSENVKNAAESIKVLAEAADTIPNEGGAWAKLFGENSLAAFGEQLPNFATQLSLFASRLGEDFNIESVKNGAKAIEVLAAAADTIPNEGGIWASIFGDNSLASFGDQLPALGSNLATFATNLGTFNDETVTTITCAANAIKAIAQGASGIDGQAEWSKTLFGDNGLAAFSGELPALGTNLAGFASNLGTFSDEQVSTVNAAVRAVKAFAALADADLKGAKKNLGGFGDELTGFATDISTFTTNMPSTESVSNAVHNLKRILSIIDDIAAANADAVGNFAGSLEKLGSDAVDKFVGAFTSSTAKTDMKKAATDLAQQAVDGIESKHKAIKTAGEDASEEAVDGMDSFSDEAKTAGKDLGKGLVNGIEAKWDAAYQAGYTLGQKAVQGEKDGQASNSPSKLTTQAGKWLGDGLIIGMKKMFGSVYNTGHRLGETATNSISATVSRIADAINTDIDSQPTIRPVLDLTDVETGASAIGSMLGGGVLANVGTINTMMNRRIQNGTNSDVVSAINKLSKKMDNMGNVTNINGITYDDGSNINQAVQAIVRAAIVERRS